MQDKAAFEPARVKKNVRPNVVYLLKEYLWAELVRIRSICFLKLLEGHRSGLEVSRTAALHLTKNEIRSNASGWNMKGCFENAYSRTK